MKEIKKVKLFVNNNIKSRKVAKIIKEELKKHKLTISEDAFDLGIAVGGDGSFLRMIKQSNFNSEAFFVGINAGTLGFAQDVSVEEITNFIKKITKQDFSYEEIGVGEVTIETENEVEHFYNLNEIVVREEELNTANFDVYVEDSLLENYVGDGLLISTSFGSTAYNLNFGGSIVFNTFETLQLTPIAPINNKSYRSLINSVIIPANKKVKLIPKNNKANLLVSVDGNNHFYNDVSKIETVIGNKTVKIIRKKDYNFIEKINDKFLN